MNIYENEVVKNELNRLESLIGTDDRDVRYDINILKDALNKINSDLLNGDKQYTIINGNMWSECHDSLDKIVYDLKLSYNDELSNYEYYEIAINKQLEFNENLIGMKFKAKVSVPEDINPDESYDIVIGEVFEVVSKVKNGIKLINKNLGDQWFIVSEDKFKELIN